MKKHYNIYLLIVTLFLLFSFTASAACVAKKQPKLNLRFKYGPVKYINNKSNSQFPQKPYSTVMGLTVSDLQRQSSGDTMIEGSSKQNYCVYLEQLNVEIGYPKIDVYIDKKYKPGSCNYKVIKEHEDYHVRVQKEGLRFFESKIKEAYKIALKKVKPQQAYTPSDAQKAAEKIVSKIEKDVQPLFDYIEQRLVEENNVIDTDEAYLSDSKKCKKW